MFLMLLIVVSGVWLYFWIFYALPSPEELNEYLLTTGNHTSVKLADIPEALQWATIVMEDKSFYSHSMNIDFSDVLHAVWTSFDCAMHKCLRMRAATIPQQLAVNLMIISNRDRGISLRQDLRDLALTLRITRRYTSREIFEFYLNSIPYTNQIYGVEAAAQFHFGKHVSDLDLAECAMLQAIRHLADFDPEKHLEIARQRQSIVLDLMVEEGYIDKQDAASAEQQALTFIR